MDRPILMVIEFYEKLHTPYNFLNSSIVNGKDSINIPRSWNGYIYEGEPVRNRLCNLPLIVKLPEDNTTKAIELSPISTAHKLWINGGTCPLRRATNTSKSEAKYYSKVIPLKQIGNPGIHCASNFFIDEVDLAVNC